MATVSPPHQWPRGPTNELHRAAYHGSTERLAARLSEGSIDIDEGNEHGYTPLMIASSQGHSGAVRILLDKGVNLSIKGDRGVCALHLSVMPGHLATSKMLVRAGADLEAMTSEGTPLHLAAQQGHLGVMSALIEAGSNTNSRNFEGTTPLFVAAQNGYIGAVKMLLRAKADPLVDRMDKSGALCVPLDLAAKNGHFEVVRELVQQVGIEGCGGASGGLDALLLAAMHQHLDIMAVFADAGVVDNGRALAAAAGSSRELSIKFLLQQRKDDDAAYVNYRSNDGGTPLLDAMGVFGFSSPSPRIVRLLVDAGADTTLPLRARTRDGRMKHLGTPLDLAVVMLREKKFDGNQFADEQLNGLEGIRRLLFRVEAVHAVSFLWPVDVPSVVGTAEGTSRKVATSTPLRRMLPMLRRRARRPGVLLAALYRSSGKP